MNPLATWAERARTLVRGPSTTERRHLAPLTTVSHVDLDRYQGTWYEIASFPQRFQRGCTDTTATYRLRSDGDIAVFNRCRRGGPGGRADSIRGRARVVDSGSNAKLEVSFFRPLWGQYWILELGDDYEYAVVGHPSRDYLWILSRTPTMDRTLYHQVLERLRVRGYDTSRLVPTVHRGVGLRPDDGHDG